MRFTHYSQIGPEKCLFHMHSQAVQEGKGSMAWRAEAVMAELSQSSDDRESMRALLRE
jgi:hypothetical protein